MTGDAHSLDDELIGVQSKVDVCGRLWWISGDPVGVKASLRSAAAAVRVLARWRSLRAGPRSAGSVHENLIGWVLWRTNDGISALDGLRTTSAYLRRPQVPSTA